MTEKEKLELLLQAIRNLKENEHFQFFLKEYIYPKREKLIRDLTKIEDELKLSNAIGQLTILNSLLNFEEVERSINGLLLLEKSKGQQLSNE